MAISLEVSPNMSALDVKPGAIKAVILEEKMIAARQSGSKSISSHICTPLAIESAVSLPCSLKYLVYTGTKAMVREPSANRRRRMLGKRKATKKASAIGPAPRTAARIRSRRNPSILLKSVATEIIPAFLAILFVCLQSVAGIKYIKWFVLQNRVWF